LQFESDITSDTTNLNYLVEDLLDTFGKSIHLFRDPTRGGLSGVLSEIASDTTKEVCIYEKDIPLDKQVAAACEILGLDPLYVANEGVFVAIVEAEIADEVVNRLRKNDKGRNAACIGEISEKKTGKVIMHSVIGGKRIVSPLIGEQLPRIC
jgi:hydrogenase expression/formation protein HypE